jgi:hypothetical protein
MKHRIVQAKKILVGAVVASTSVATPAVAADNTLMALRAELVATPAKDALARVAHFRPLCDKDGYPLVGNVASGGKSAGNGLQPSQFCASVRKARGSS